MEFIMSTLSIPPISSVSSGVELAGTNSPGLQQAAFNNLLSRLQQAISAGNLSSSKSLLNALDALPPRGVSEMTALTKFLSGVGAALANGSVEDAQSALSAFQAATTQGVKNSPPSIPGNSASSDTAIAASSIAGSQVQSQLQLNLVSALLLPPGLNAPSDGVTTNSVNSLIAFLNTAYGNSEASPGASANAMQSPYDTLVSALKSNLAAGISTAGPALAYLQSKGSLVSMEA
jgi:hypothetical protein